MMFLEKDCLFSGTVWKSAIITIADFQRVPDKVEKAMNEARQSQMMLTCAVFVIVALLILATHATAHAQQWTPASGHRQVALWPRGVPDSQAARGPESVATAKN